LSTLWATALEMTSWPESTKYISSPTSPSRNSAWPPCTARQVIRDANVSISGPLNARKISSVRRMAMVAGAGPPARRLAGPPAGTAAKRRAARAAATAGERGSPAGRRSPSRSRGSMSRSTPSSPLFERLPLGVQQVFHARHDERLGLDRAQRLRVVAAHAGRGAHVVALVGPRLVDVVVGVEGVEDRVLLRLEPRQHVERVGELVPVH